MLISTSPTSDTAENPDDSMPLALPDGYRSTELWFKILCALDLDAEEVRNAAEWDWKTYSDWLDEPIPFRLEVEPPMPCPDILKCFDTIDLYFGPPPRIVDLPNCVRDTDRATEFACALAREKHSSALLILSRRVTLRIDETGHIVQEKTDLVFNDDYHLYAPLGRTSVIAWASVS